MEIKIEVAKRERLEEYYEIFEDSALADHYFRGTNLIHEWIDDFVGDDRKEIFIAYTTAGEAIGLIHFTMDGMCGFPHCFLLGVKKQYRGMGIGQQLLNFFFKVVESTDLPNMYIMTSTFNVRAFRLYQKMGFKKVGIIPGFILKDVNEYFLIRPNKNCKQPSAQKGEINRAVSYLN